MEKLYSHETSTATDFRALMLCCRLVTRAFGHDCSLMRGHAEDMPKLPAESPNQSSVVFPRACHFTLSIHTVISHSLDGEPHE